MLYCQVGWQVLRVALAPAARAADAAASSCTVVSVVPKALSIDPDVPAGLLAQDVASHVTPPCMDAQDAASLVELSMSIIAQ